VAAVTTSGATGAREASGRGALSIKAHGLKSKASSPIIPAMTAWHPAAIEPQLIIYGDAK